jgi:hypothetical protein
MKNEFKISKYEKNGECFVKTGYHEYDISYLKGLKINELRIVVNNYLTTKKINILSCNEGYKDKILSAIQEYELNKNKYKNKVSKFITIDYLKRVYSEKIINNIINRLIPIKKEENRDILTKYNLIDY